MVSKVLVANRGEIARRVFRTCRELGLSTVAVYSDVDADEPHALEADERVALEGSTPAETYLDIEAVLHAAKLTGADAIHPGYGFLAENPEFARRVGSAGLTWIGPSPEAIEIMGSKLASKRLMVEAGVPTLPSIEIETSTDVGSAGREIGFPVLVKASAGGGGKGMRIVDDPADLSEAIESAKREAESAFGDGTIFLEKYLPAPRHIEIQVFGDNSGNVISLHERECSIQRRHQKIVEEAPSPVINETIRAEMSTAATDAAAAVNYVGAGTVEFLYHDGGFFFLEMNTRLQVEHPVTEMITGIDLVRLQIEVAQGGEVPQQPPPIQGHAIEVRLYAEDPLNDFLPVTGEFHRFEFPGLEGLRVDAGIESGSKISVFYDPMIAKVVAHGSSRETAASTLAMALRQSQVHGSTTNLELLVRILESDEFLAGHTDTAFLERNDVRLLSRPLIDNAGEATASLASAVTDQAFERRNAVLPTIPSGWRNMAQRGQERSYRGVEREHHVTYDISSGRASVDGRELNFEDPQPTTVLVEGQQVEVSRYGQLRYVDSDQGTARLTVVPRFPDPDLDETVGSLHAPMPGKVIRVDTVVGAEVSEGDLLVVLEAMKMEHTLRAPHTGTVSQVSCAPGDQVEANAILIVVDEI